MTDINKRRFSDKYRWQLWSAQELSKTLEFSPKFWDDPIISAAENAQIKWFVGVEVHNYSLVVAVYGYHLDQVYLGPIVQYDTTQDGYTKLSEDLKKFSIRRFLMENSGIYHFQVYWELKKLFPQAQIVVMNSSELARHIKKTRKSDKADAVKLAQFARYNELIHLSYCPKKDDAYLRDLSRVLIRQTEDQVRMKNRIKKLLAMYGFRWSFNYNIQSHITFIRGFLQTSSTMEAFIASYSEIEETTLAKIKPWKAFDPPQDLREILLFELDQLAIREIEREMVEARLTRLIKQQPELSRQASLLETIPGLGWLNCVSIILEIGDIHRFRTMNHFVSYCGIGPAGGSSGAPELGSLEEKVVQKDHPNRRCNPQLKKIFTQAAMVNLKEARLGHCSTDITRYASTLPDEKKKRMKSRFKVAAKIARQLFHCLANDIVFNNQSGITTAVIPRISAHKKRIQAKIRKLLKKNELLVQAWEQVFGYLTAMGLDATQIDVLRKNCSFSGVKE
jgi:transposase